MTRVNCLARDRAMPEPSLEKRTPPKGYLGLANATTWARSIGTASRSADRIATEQIAHSVAQLTAGQEQMTREITKLQAVEQYVLYKNSGPPPRPAPAPVHSPVLRPSPAR
jgi:hypothetical protein